MLAIVPARGGSRGVPGKNLARVGGRSLVEWAVRAALESRHAPRVIVSTDDPATAAEGRRVGAEVPFMRPSELAGDDTPGIAPVLHAVRWLQEGEAYRPEWVVLLQPTSPLRRAEDVDGALDLAMSRGADAVVSVAEAASHPYWTQALDDDGRLRPFVVPDPPVSRRQDLPPAYALNGAVYVIRREVLLARETLVPPGTRGHVMPAERSLDVDTAWELHLANLILLDRGANAHG